MTSLSLNTKMISITNNHNITDIMFEFFLMTCRLTFSVLYVSLLCRSIKRNSQHHEIVDTIELTIVVINVNKNYFPIPTCLVTILVQQLENWSQVYFLIKMNQIGCFCLKTGGRYIFISFHCISFPMH